MTRPAQSRWPAGQRPPRRHRQNMGSGPRAPVEDLVGWHNCSAVTASTRPAECFRGWQLMRLGRPAGKYGGAHRYPDQACAGSNANQGGVMQDNHTITIPGWKNQSSRR